MAKDYEDEGKDALPASKSNLAFLIAGSLTSCLNTLKPFLILLMIGLARVWYSSKAEKHFLHIIKDIGTTKSSFSSSAKFFHKLKTASFLVKFLLSPFFVAQSHPAQSVETS